MKFLKGLWALLVRLPDLISLLKAIGEAVEAGVDFVDVRIKLGKFDKAIDKAKKEKDTSALEGVFNPKSDPGPDRPGQLH